MNKNFYNNEEQFSKQQLQGNRDIHELKLRYKDTISRNSDFTTHGEASITAPEVVKHLCKSVHPQERFYFLAQKNFN